MLIFCPGRMIGWVDSLRMMLGRQNVVMVKGVDEID